MNEFQENILDHYRNPRNFGKPVWNITNTIQSKNISCGDEITLFAYIKDNIISELAFEGEGCSISIASASIITDEFKGKSLDEIKSMEDDSYLHDFIGIELTLSRRKCALLAFSALKKL